MLIYALYIPAEQTSWNRERVFAFASIERFIGGMKLVNEMGERKGTLRPITKEEALKMTSIATLFTVSDKDASFDRGVDIFVYEEGIRDTWDGKSMKIDLVEKIEDENIPSVSNYA